MKKLQTLLIIALAAALLAGCGPKSIAIQEGSKNKKGGGSESTEGLYD